MTGDKNGATLPVVNSFIIFILAVGLLLALSGCWRFLAAPRLRKGPSGDARIELIRFFVENYTRRFHRLKVEGLENLSERPSGALLVISNHASPIDPFLIQASFPHLFIHWMMAKDQMNPDSQGFWKWMRVISTDRFKADPAAALSALRLLRRDKPVGIFPEGRLETTQGSLLPFQPGVGTLASLSGAPILLLCVDGTPATHSTLIAFLRPSRSRVRVLDLLQFSKGHDPDEINQQLRDRILAETGWDQDEETEPLLHPPDPFLG